MRLTESVDYRVMKLGVFANIVESSKVRRYHVIKTKWLKVLFIIYLFLLLYFVIFKLHESALERIKSIHENRSLGYWNYNLTLLRSIRPYLKNIADSYAYFNILGNIIPFIPLGFMLPQITTWEHRKAVKNSIFLFLILVVIEIFQFITMLGYFDVDDLLLNYIGCFLGYMALGILKLLPISEFLIKR